MRHVDNDRWAGDVPPRRDGPSRYTIEALAEPFRSWLADLEKREDGGRDLASALGEGLALIRAGGGAGEHGGRPPRPRRARRPHRARRGAAEAVAAGRRRRAGRLMERHLDRAEATRSRARARGGGRPRAGALRRLVRVLSALRRAARPERDLPEAEAQLARVAAWASTSSTCRRSTRSAAPTARGATTRSVAAPGDPGSPWAIGSAEGGYTAVHPDLGTLDDFDRFVGAARRLGLEVALDFAIQCSPDHPWVREHPEWFFHRPDGTIKYAENPPKKYQDIYPLNFQCEDRARALGRDAADPRVLDRPRREARSAWTIPHTKPVRFWEWLIRDVQDAHPEVIFLAEAFTRPKMMRVLAKAGFTQSYTYFTWRNDKQELTEYLTEITTPAGRRVLPRQPLAEHARHPPRDAAARRPAGLQDAPRARGHPLLALRHLLRLRALRERAARAGLGGVPELREVRVQGCGTGTRPATSWTT